MSSSRKGSHSADAAVNCYHCDVIIDSADFIQCNLCNQKFHGKKECSNMTAASLKVLKSTDNVTYMCNHCKTMDFSTFFSRFAAIEAELASLREQLKAKTSIDLMKIVDCAIDEHEKRNEKRCNVVVFGLDENDDAEDDREAVDVLLGEINVEYEDSVQSVTRLGIRRKKNRPIQIRFKSFSDKRRCLQNAKMLKNNSSYRKVFIRPDLTPSQVEQNKRLHSDLKTRRDAGEDVFIRNGQIVQKKAHQ